MNVQKKMLAVTRNVSTHRVAIHAHARLAINCTHKMVPLVSSSKKRRRERKTATLISSTRPVCLFNAPTWIHLKMDFYSPANFSTILVTWFDSNVTLVTSCPEVPHWCACLMENGMRQYLSACVSELINLIYFSPN
jgi:hypothetical protein